MTREEALKAWENMPESSRVLYRAVWAGEPGAWDALLAALAEEIAHAVVDALARWQRDAGERRAEQTEMGPPTEA
jgi:hypothetical protein